MKSMTPAAWHAQISGKIAEAMAYKNMKKTDISKFTTGNREKLTRFTTDKRLYDLRFFEVVLIAISAGYDIQFVRREEK